MIRYLGIVNYLNDISHSDYIEKTYANLQDKFNITKKLDLFKTTHINLSDGFITKSFGSDKYVIMFIGNIFNIKDIKKKLSIKGYTFSTKTKLKKDKIIPLRDIDNYLDAEVLLTSYHEYKEKFLDYLDGTFSICIYDKTNNIVFLCRDRIGIKPLYYTKNKIDNSFIFSTNIKDILNVPNMKGILDKQGLLELIGIGPSHSPGFTFFKNIYELLPGHYAIYSNIGIITHKYWDLPTKALGDTKVKIINTIHSLLKKSVKLQTSNEDSICLLSPENESSSIILGISRKNIKKIDTYSYNLENNISKNKNPDTIKTLNKQLGIDNKNIISDTKVLYSLLIPAMMARDMPGMPYLDCQILEFFTSIKNKGFNKCVSSLCSIEIFKIINSDSAPFILSLSKDIRRNLINKNVINGNILDDYINLRYNENIKDIVYLENEDEHDKKLRQSKYINIKWYINSLVERINYISSNIDLDISLPYADYRILEYIYNIPNNLNSIDDSIIKSIFSKYFTNKSNKLDTNNRFNLTFSDMLEHEIKRILISSNSKLLKIINKDYILELIESKKLCDTSNEYDILMSYNQILAYVIQIDYWLTIYDIDLEF